MHIGSNPIGVIPIHKYRKDVKVYLIVNMKDNSIFTGITPTGRYKLESFNSSLEKTIVACPIFLFEKEASSTLVEIAHHFIGADMKVLSISEFEKMMTNPVRKDNDE